MEDINDTGNLEKLRQLTKHLNELKTNVVGPIVDHYLTQYSKRPGMAVAQGLFKRKEVSVLEAILKATVIIESHVHDCHEWVIVYKGKIRVTDASGVKEYGVGECYYAPPGLSHITTCDEDSAVIGVTVPMEEAYPDVTGS
jgi:quercetin dioxygenase-like cupin family protein